MEPRFSLIIPTQADAIALFIFLACSVGITLVAESFRLLLEQLDAMERQKDLLFRELAHRTRNNLQIVMSMLAMERAQAASGDTRTRLDLIEGRIGVLAQMHDRLQWQDSNGAIKIRDFVENLCAGGAGPWDPPAPPPGHRRAAVSHRLRPVPSRFVTAQSSLPTMMVCSASSGAMTRLLGVTTRK